MPHEPWRDWYHCIVGTYGQWLPGDPRGWHERHHHEHVPGTYKNPPKPTAFSKARHAHSQRIMNWSAYAIVPEDRPTIGRFLLEAFRHQRVPALALAVCQSNFHALIQVPAHNPKRILGLAKCHVTFGLAPIIDAATHRRRQIWEGGALAKPIHNRAHAVQTFHYILDHIKEGAWAWSYRDDPLHLQAMTPAISDGAG